MKSNIYDLLISELVLNSGSGSSTPSTSTVTSLTLSNDLGSNSVIVNFVGNVTYTSTVNNMPAGYSISASSHVINYPATAATVGSGSPIVGAATPVVLNTNGATFTVTSTVTLTSLTDPTIVLNATNTITAVASIYYGVKPYESFPILTSLSSQPYTLNQFSLTSTVLGRFFIVFETGLLNFDGLLDDGGQFWPVSDFTLITNLGYDFYQLNWDTQLTGTVPKIFTIITS